MSHTRQFLTFVFAAIVHVAPAMAADQSITIHGDQGADPSAVATFVTKFEGELHTLDITVEDASVELDVITESPTNGLWQIENTRSNGANFRLADASAHQNHASSFKFRQKSKGGAGGGSGGGRKTYEAISQQIQIFASYPGEPEKEAPRPTQQGDEYYGIVLPNQPEKPVRIRLVYNRSAYDSFDSSSIQLAIANGLKIVNRPADQGVAEIAAELQPGSEVTFDVVHDSVSVPVINEPLPITLTLTDQFGAIHEDEVKLVPVEIVPDWNRDAVITGEDSGKVTQKEPFRWWVNDDNDSGEIGKAEKVGINETKPIDVPGIGEINHKDQIINGMRDLVDFFPLHLKLDQALKAFPKSKYKYLVKHKDGAVKFHEVKETILDVDPENNGPTAYLRKLDKSRSLAAANVKWATTSGVNLSGEILDAFAEGNGIIICEATKESDNPLVVEIRNNDGNLITEIKFPVKFSGVEKMYRHGNMRGQVGGGSGGLATQMNDPGKPYPDSLTNGKYFVFLHGFNVDGEAARGWHAEVFKRLHQVGSRARFVGISWHGDTSPDYHKAVKYAFITSERLASWLQFSGQITIAAHSLGNMVVSNAIEHEGLDVQQYIMINAATPIEAYDVNQKNGADHTLMEPRMTENEWKKYDRRLYSGNWHELFAANPDDGRNKLTWGNRFASKVPSVAYNFYSTGEDVVENADATESFVGNAAMSVLMLDFSRHAWVQQEIAKGNPAAVALLKDTHAGWDFNFIFEVSRPIFPPIPQGYYKWMTDPTGRTVTRKYDPDEASELTDEQLKAKPFHWPFKYSDIYDPAKGSAKAENSLVQQELLAAAIPAMSYAVAANPVNIFEDKNFDMMNQKRGGWPRETGDWHHSDFRDVAFGYVHLMYQEMISIGQLDQ